MFINGKLSSYASILVVFLSILAFFQAGCGSSKQSGTFQQVKNSEPREARQTDYPLAISPTSTETQNPLYIPIIVATSRQSAIESLIKNNGGCRLPCLWGITPGQTDFTEAQEILFPLQVLIGENNQIDFEYTKYVPSTIQGRQNDEIVINARFQFDANRIIKIVRVNTFSTAKNDDFSDLWESISPQQVIRSFGKPSRVLLNAYPGPFGTKRHSPYRLWFFYDREGIEFNYIGAVKFDSVYHFCPKLKKDEDITVIKIYIQSPDDHSPLEENDEQIVNLNTPPFKVLSFEEATGKSLDDFYQIFTLHSDSACFDTPSEIWNDD